MTDKITGATRLQRIARALVACGPMPLRDIRLCVHAPRYPDMHELIALGYVVVSGKAPAAASCQVKELDVYKITKAGAEFAATQAKPKLRGPGKPKLNRVDISFKSVKATTKLVPAKDVEITVTENTKFTKYEPKFTYQTYQQPKSFMECVR